MRKESQPLLYSMLLLWAAIPVWYHTTIFSRLILFFNALLTCGSLSRIGDDLHANTNAFHCRLLFNQHLDFNCRQAEFILIDTIQALQDKNFGCRHLSENFGFG